MNSEKPERQEIGGKERDLMIARVMLGIVALGLLFSGLTCYALSWEVKAVIDYVFGGSPDRFPFMGDEYWLLVKVSEGLALIDERFPEFMLGTDWLGFAHVILAILFAGALIPLVIAWRQLKKWDKE